MEVPVRTDHLMCMQCFTEVTAVISRSSMPTLPWALPMYELMCEHLIAFMDDTERPLTIREAACAGHEKLMHYYKIARESMHVIVATGALFPFSLCNFHAYLAPACHPTLRTDWFLKLGENNHTRVLTVFRHVYEEYASNMSQPEDQPAACDGFDSGSDNGILGSAAAHPVVEQTHPHTESQSEFARWVANEGGPGKMHHPLIWWKVRRHARLIRKLTYVRMAYQAHAKEFPVIAKMAQDFLAVMGTSVSVERLFSSSRHICRDTRSSLKADSVSSLLLAKKWLQDPTIFRKVFGVSM
jgi:hypothetical protein